MNNLIGTINRELILKNTKLNILFTHTDDKSFSSLLRKLGHTLLSYDDLYFAYYVPNIILCNDKIVSYEKVSILSIQYHIPIIFIDHSPPNFIIDKSKIEIMNNIPNSYKVCIDNNIFEQWGRVHDLVLDIKEQSAPLWNDLLLNISKRIFTL